jgi:hypothetical protein
MYNNNNNKVVFNMTQFHLTMSSVAEVDLSKLDDLTFSQAKTRGCVVSSFDMLEMNEFVLHVQQAMLTLEPISSSDLSSGSSSPSNSLSSLIYHNGHNSLGMNEFVQSLLSFYVNVLSRDYNDDTDKSIMSFITHPEMITIPPLPSGNGIHMDLAPELNKLLNNSGKLIDKFLLDNLVNNANDTCHNVTTVSPTSVDDDNLPTFDDDQEGVNVAGWETSMGLISFAVMALVILASGLFSWMARMRRRKAAASRGYGHLGNEFVVVRADELFGGDNSQSSSSGESNEDEPNSTSTGGSGVPKATIGKPIEQLFKDSKKKQRVIDGDHITPGKHLDENGNEIDENEIVDSLFQSDRISKGYRYGLPGCCAVVALIFVSANCYPGAAVYAELVVGPLEPVTTFNFFTFTLKSSVHDFWEAKVYFLSVLIAALSGAWPYGKLILIATCFIVPMQ